MPTFCGSAWLPAMAPFTALFNFTTRDRRNGYEIRR